MTVRAPNLVSFGLTWQDALDLDVPDARHLIAEITENIESLPKK